MGESQAGVLAEKAGQAGQAVAPLEESGSLAVGRNIQALLFTGCLELVLYGLRELAWRSITMKLSTNESAVI